MYQHATYSIILQSDHLLKGYDKKAKSYFPQRVLHVKQPLVKNKYLTRQPWWSWGQAEEAWDLTN